ncbi:MAG: GNAT family N-acetyltransferase, partial [Acidimicrobiales bacterium]
DLLMPEDDQQAFLDLMWPEAARMIKTLGEATVEMTVRDDNVELAERITAYGFRPTEEVGMATWLNSSERPAPAAAAEGFSISSRDVNPTREHHLAARNGSDIAIRLTECSLYDPWLDLVVYGPDDDVAAYGLFWADTITGVGLVEPMRTEEPFQQLGLASALLATGLDRLANRGCSRMKVTYLLDNRASIRLYLGAGFIRTSSSTTYQLH